MKMIEIEGLTKSFGDVKAVNNLSFSVEEGELFAFLGVNGAGKSTTISIISGLIPEDSGSVLISGMRMCDDVRRLIGVVYQFSTLDKAMTVKDNLKSRAALYGIWGKEFDKRLSELTEVLDLTEILNRPFGKLSGGQKRRADIARALFHRPRLLILDEPTTGLDPKTRRLIWDTVTDLRKKEHITVLLTTHYMEEASGADSVLIISKGSKVAEGTPPELKNRYTGDYIDLYSVSEDEVKLLSQRYERTAHGYRILVPDTKSATGLICAHPEIFRDYEIIKGGMDDVFLAVTGSAPEVDEK